MARYRFLTNEDSLGAGGFGSVHPCCEVDEDGTVLNDQLAVKLCIVEDDEDPDEKYRRFRNGGRLGKRLRHPNVMPVIASGDRKRDGTPFIVMPHADGGNLEDWLAIRRSEEERVDVFRQVLEAIAFAHSAIAECFAIESRRTRKRGFPCCRCPVECFRLGRTQSFEGRRAR
jgi:serine/threonine protein kinase